jgi:WD40 repeat protein
MWRSSEFNGAIAGRNVIAGLHLESGATMNNYFGEVNLVASSPDSKLVVSGSQVKLVRVWDAETGVA